MVVLVATERLDADACQRLSVLIGGAPILTSDEYDMYQLVSVLRACHLMVSSRYHGIVTSMPGLVPSAGISMDERISNIMIERGHEDLLLKVDDPELEPKLLAVMEKLRVDGDRIRDGITRTVLKNLKVMARMGVYFEENVRQRYAEFPTRSGVYTWEDYLPPLSSSLLQLAEACA
jgi:polysaccharide pyruvyl transferase WcaK-like protein